MLYPISHGFGRKYASYFTLIPSFGARGGSMKCSSSSGLLTKVIICHQLAMPVTAIDHIML